MKIETKYNIGDQAVGVTKDYVTHDQSCDACHGNGGANIPGSRVWVECRECGGKGTIEVSRFEYGAQLVKIATIEVRCGEYDQTPRITYGYRVYIHHHILHAAFDTMVEASVEAGRMNTKERTDG